MTDEQTSTDRAQAYEIGIDWSDEPLPVHSNGAQVVHDHREFALAFTEFAPFAGRRRDPDADEKRIAERARVVSSVRMSPDVFFQLAAAVASNWNKFVNRFGDPNQPAPKFKLIGAGSFQLEGLEPPGSDTD